MTQNISRRSLAKGAAWTVPAVAVTTTAPAVAASPKCTDAEKAKINQLFEAALAKARAITTPVWEINLYQPAAAGDGYAASAYVNVKNISGTNQFVDFSNRLMFDINVYQQASAPTPDAAGRNGRQMLRATSSFGQFNVDGGQYLNANQIAYPVQPNKRDAAWSATADALTNSYKWQYFGGTVANNREIDFALGFGDGLEWVGGQSFRYTNYLTVTPTISAAVALAPTFDATDAGPACKPYYDQKLAAFEAATAGTPASKFVVRGPKGTRQIGVGETVDSRALGNFSSVTGTNSTNGIW